MIQTKNQIVHMISVSKAGLYKVWSDTIWSYQTGTWEEEEERKEEGEE